MTNIREAPLRWNQERDLPPPQVFPHAALALPANGDVSVPGVKLAVLPQAFRNRDGNERADQGRTSFEPDLARELVAMLLRHISEAGMDE